MKTVGIKSQQTIKIVEKPQNMIKQGDNVKLENTIYGDFEITVKEIKSEQKNTVIIAESQLVGETNNNNNTIENLMSDMLAEAKNKDDKNVTFEITLTKRQKAIWDKKGGVQWLKKKLV